MTWTPENVINLVGILCTFIGVVGGWYVVSKLNKANTEKAKAEAASIYQKMANEAAIREQQERREKEKQQEDIEILKETINRLEQKVADLTETNKNKDERIADLESLSNRQEKRIKELERSNQNLEQEIQALRLKRK
jgi:archaellum component FlaC